MRPWTFLGALLALALAVFPAGAVSGYLTSFESTYPAAKNSAIDSCTLCHTSPPARNSFGAAFKSAGHRFAAVENADSDGDGFTNLAEISAHTFPGDAASHPAAATTGSLTVNISPAAVVAAGAQWRTGTGVYQNSGATVSGLAPGSVTINFKPVAGWTTPADQQATVLAGQTVTAGGNYTAAQVTVPSVVGQTQAAATTALTAAGLVVGVVNQAFSPTVPSGQVMSQTPTAGATATGGSAVGLTISKGPQPVTVPNVVGQNQATATAAITTAGLVLGAVTQRHDATVPAGIVISQTPAANTQVSPGSAVGLLVSQGPGQVTVPDVAGQTQLAATATLTRGGLVPGTVTQEYSATVLLGRVISQTPSANAQADAGAAVALVLSQGAQPVSVPDLTGLTQDAATAALTAVGLTVGQVTETSSDTVPAGSVISQSPAANTQAVPPAMVNLMISTGPQSSGCAALGCQKSTFSLDGFGKILGDLFTVALALIALQLLAKQK